MTFNMIGAMRIPDVIAPPMRLADPRQAAGSGHESVSEQKAVDETSLSLAQPRDLQRVDEGHSLSVLRYKSGLKLKQTDDGALKIKFKSQLKFTYQFQSEDGTTLKISAKVKTHVSYQQTGEESSDFKARVKFKLTMVQKTVASGLAPVLDSDSPTDEQRLAVSSVLQDFGDVIELVTSQFLDDTLAGDDLIGNVVDAFNELTRSAQSEVSEGAEPPIAPAEQPPLDKPAEVVDDVVLPVDVAEPGVFPVDLMTEEDEIQSAIGDTQGTGQPTSQPVDDIGDSGNGETVEGDAGDPLEVIAGSGEPEMPSVASFYSDRSLFVDLRVKFVQSLSQLVSVLDSSSNDAESSVMNTDIRAHIKLDLRLAAYSQTQARGENLPGFKLDTGI